VAIAFLNILTMILKDPIFNIYDPALIGVATASYIDVMAILDSIQSLDADGTKNKFKAVFVVGDQQTYDRMCVLVMDYPERYRWCIPMNGDFHFVAHVAAAFHALYCLPFTSWISSTAGLIKSLLQTSSTMITFIFF